MPKLTTTGAGSPELYYRDSGGPGRPLVLIHGWPASAASWDAVADRLEEAGYRVIAYDRRGFGHSDHAETGYDYDTFASDLNDLMAELDLIDAVLVGFSMGGGEVARYVANHGTGRVTGAILIAAITPALDASLPDNLDGGFTPDAAAGMQAGLRENPNGFLTEFLTNFFSVPADGGARLMVPQETVLSSIEVAHQASLDALATSIELWLTDFRADLAALGVPTLVIHGDGDQIVPIQVSGARIPQYVPQAKVVRIADGPHGLLASHPEQVADAMLDFLG